MNNAIVIPSEVSVSERSRGTSVRRGDSWFSAVKGVAPLARVAISVGMTLVVAASAAAQTTVATVDPGMTRAEVVAKLGEPLSARTFNSLTYLFYKNGCEKTCGMNDLVTLDSGKVIDAVFRSPHRKYSGTSSSPRMISMTDAKKADTKKSAPLKTPPPKPKKP